MFGAAHVTATPKKDRKEKEKKTDDHVLLLLVFCTGLFHLLLFSFVCCKVFIEFVC